MNYYYLKCFCLFIFILLFPSLLIAKQTADIVILGPTIVTMNKEYDIFYNGGIAILGDKIIAVGKRSEIEGEFVGKETRITTNSWLIPGLINTHTHAPMILLRGLGNDQSLTDWLEKSIWPIEQKWGFDPTFIEDGMLLAGWEMLLNGTTTHLNSYFLPNIAANACKTLGIRCICAHGIVDTGPFLKERTANDLLDSCEAFLRKWQNDSLITPAIAPHSLYLCSPKTISKCFDLVEKYGSLVTLHAAETLWEKEKILNVYGTTIIQLLNNNKCLRPNLLLSHVIWVDDEEIKLLKMHDVKVAYCPQSNMKLASGIAPIRSLLAHGVVVGLGTDGPASNNSLDLFQEMDVGAKLQKIASKDPSACPAQAMFSMVTIEAAKSLGLENKIGSIEVGKLADLVLLNSQTPLMAPIYDPYAHLVYTVRGHCVDSVLISGKWVLQNRRLVSMDEEALIEKAHSWQHRIQDYLDQASGTRSDL